jgi:hypothetical protein
MTTKKQLFLATAIAALLVSTASQAASPNRNVPTPPAQAVANAAAAGINLLNTIASDAGAGNGPEVAVSDVSTVNVPSSQTATDTSIVAGETTTSSLTSTSTTKGPVSDWTQFSNGQNFVLKKYQDVTTETVVTETSTTPQTQVVTTTTTNYETPVTTTTYEELDPGKSTKNNSPEAGAPDPLVETGETVQVGDPVVTTDSTVLDPVVDSTITSDTQSTETTTVSVCNPSDSHPCL